MNRTQRSIILSPFFSFILLFHCMVCSSHTARASNPSPFFDYSPDEKSQKINKGLPEDILKHLISYLPQKDAISLSLTSKAVQSELKSIFNDNVSRKLTEKDYLWPSDKFSTDNLYINLNEACKLLSPSDQPSPKDTTLLISGHSSIHMEHASVLTNFFGRDKYGVSLPQKDKKDTGNHSTQPLGQVYIKADDYLFNGRTNPLDFMMEKAVSLLSYHLFPQERLIAYSQIATFNNLHKVKIVEENDTYLSAIPGLVQIAEKVEGIRLDEVLKKVPSQGYDAWYKDHFSLDSYQSFVLLSLLIRPADYKADNIMLKKEKNHKGQEVYHLVGIDNDMAFADSLVDFHGATHVGVKNILYALPLMDEPFTQEVIQGIKGWNPALIVIQWLKDLDHYNQHYTSLFEGQFKERYNTIPLWIHTEGEEPYPARFPLKLREGTAIKLYEDLNHIKKVVEDKEVNKGEQEALTLHQAFQTIDPLLADYYRWLREEYKTILIDQGQGAEQAYKHTSGELYKNKKEWKTLEELFTQNNLNQGLKSQLALSKDSKAYLKERTQGLNAALAELFKTISFSNIFDAKDLTPSVLRWVFNIIQPHIDNPRTTLNALLQAYPHKQSSISFELMDLLLIYCKKKLSGAQDENTLNGPQGPLNYHTFLNQEDTFARAPLDYAIKTRDPKLITYLIQEGAHTLLPASLKEMNILAFQTQDSPFHEAVKVLLDHYPQLHWQMTLDEVFSSSKDVPILLYAFEPQQVYGMDPKMLSYIMEQEQGTSTKRKEIKLIRHNTYGKRAVSWLKSGPVMEGDIKKRTLRIGEHALYLKWKPEFPLLEMAAGKLMRLIMGEGAPYSTLMHVRQGKVLSLPALASQAIQGLTLYDVLRQDRKDIYDNIDPSSLSKALVMSMILNPEDGNPTNYIVEPIPLTQPQKYRLVSIDNERILVPSVATALIGHKQKTSLQVRTILYCLEAMQEPVHGDVIKIMEELDVFHTLKSWLQELNILNKEGLGLFEPDEITRLIGQHESIIGIPFVEGSIGDLYTRVMYLKTAIERHEPGSLTHFDLLKSIDPFLAGRYQASFKSVPHNYKHSSLKSILERWGSVDGEGYQTLKGEAWKPRADIPPISTSAFSHFLPSLKLPSKEELQRKLRKNEMGPTQALKELSTIEEVHKDTHLLLKQVTGYEGPSFLGVMLGNKFTFKEGGHLSTKSKERALKKIFTQVNTGKLILTKAQEQAIFEGLVLGTELREFMFTQSLTLTAHLLKQINTRYLTSVDISGAYKMAPSPWLLYSDSINQLIAASPNLTELYINHMKDLSTLKVDAPDSSLKKLYAQGITGLQQVTLNIPSLESLDLSSNLKLLNIDLNTPHLKLLALKDSVQIKDIFVGTILKPELIINAIEAYVSPRVTKIVKRVHPSVKELYLKNNSLKYIDIFYLIAKGSFNHIEVLNLSYQTLREKNISTLIQYPVFSNLTFLDLSYKNIRDEGTIAISQNSNLKNLFSLDLGSNNIRAGGAVAISKSSSLTNLTSLSLGDNEIRDEGAIAISKSSTLTKLSFLKLVSNAIGVEGAIAISQSSSLTNLTSLSLWNNNIRAGGAVAISQSSTLRNLSSLNLGINKIGAEGAIAISQSSTLKNLSSLDLRDNNIGAGGAVAISQSSTLRNLTSLDLAINEIGDEGAVAISQSSTLKNLTSLDLAINEIGAGGAVAISQSSTLRNLTSLDLAINEIGDEGAVAISQSSTLKNLSSLDLERNNIGDEGVIAISQSSTLRNLSSLDLSSNKIGDKGAIAISQSSTLKNLTSLVLWNNNTGDEGDKAISKSLTLTNLKKLF